MNEAFMTGYQMSNVSNFIESLNTLNKDAYLYGMTIVLTGAVRNDEGAILGQIKYDTMDEAYVFVPGAYEVYDV